MSDQTTITPKDLLKKATLPERLIAIVTDRALVAVHQSLTDDLNAAQKARAGDRRMASDVKEIAKKLTDVEQQMADSKIEFKLRGFPLKEWRALKAKHPVGDEPTRVDTMLGADATGLFNEAVQKSIVSPELDDEDWENLLAMLTDGEWERFTNAVYGMNEEGTGIPFSRVASTLLQENDDD